MTFVNILIHKLISMIVFLIVLYEIDAMKKD